MSTAVVSNVGRIQPTARCTVRFSRATGRNLTLSTQLIARKQIWKCTPLPVAVQYSVLGRAGYLLVKPVPTRELSRFSLSSRKLLRIGSFVPSSVKTTRGFGSSIQAAVNSTALDLVADKNCIPTLTPISVFPVHFRRSQL